MNTARRFPRTAGEAFKDAGYACAVERPMDKPDRIVFKAALAIAAVLLALAVTGGIA